MNAKRSIITLQIYFVEGPTPAKVPPAQRLNKHLTMKCQILKEDQKLNWNNPISPPWKEQGELEITRLNRTRMTRIIRIFTDNLIRAYPRHQCHPCSIS